MGDYRDVIKAAYEQGFNLDSCGQAERQYDFGLFNDLCGMSVEEAMHSGDSEQYVATFEIAGLPSTSVTFEYNTPIIYPDVKVDEGYYVKWENAPELMPRKDITIRGEIKEIEEGGIVYYGSMLHSLVPSITSSQIKEFDNYDISNKEHTVTCVIPQSEVYLDYEQKWAEADDEGNLELVTQYEELMSDFEESHQYGALFIIPENVELEDILSNGVDSIMSSTALVKEMMIDDAKYNLYEYTNEERAFKQTDYHKSYEFDIIIA